MKTKKVAIIGASGYSGEVLVQLLLNHPHAELVAVTSRQNAGQTLAQVFPKFASHPKSKTLRFSEPNAELLAKQADVVFLALPHGVAAEYAVPLLNTGCVVIDLSADFRLKSAEIYKEFYAHDHPAPDLLKKSVYGLPEIYRDEIKKSLLIASPGCYPTSILLPTIPLLKAGLVKPAGIIADSLSGVSGAGRKAEIDYLFCECNESVRPTACRSTGICPKSRNNFQSPPERKCDPVHAALDSGESGHFDDALSRAGKIFHRRGENFRLLQKFPPVTA
jgi:N-acetyl-gamma-glutamyl-phosphate reductase